MDEETRKLIYSLRAELEELKSEGSPRMEPYHYCSYTGKFGAYVELCTRLAQVSKKNERKEGGQARYNLGRIDWLERQIGLSTEVHEKDLQALAIEHRIWSNLRKWANE